MSGQSLFKSSSRQMNFNVGSVTPSQISKLFKIPLDDIILQDEDKNTFTVDAEKNIFEPSLAPNKVYDVIDSTKNIQTAHSFLALMPSDDKQREIVQNVINSSVITGMGKRALDLAHLIPACACVEYLFLTGATALDYTLVSAAVQEFKFLTNPKSMKVSVTQVAQEMSLLIQNNKSDLDFINLKMAFVAGQFKYVLPAIWQKNGILVTDIAKKMENATTVCIQKSEKCVDRCEHLVNTIGELIQAMLGAKQDNEIENTRIQQSLEELNEKIKLVQEKNDRKKRELGEQQKKFDAAYSELQERQQQSGNIMNNFLTACLDAIPFIESNTREEMDTAYKNAEKNKKEEDDKLKQLNEEYGKVEDELNDLKIKCKKDELQKEGLQGIIASINETIRRIEILTATVSNMKEYFQAINNLVKVTFKANADLFIENAKKDEISDPEKAQMLEAVVNSFGIFSVVQNFATIYSIAASSDGVQDRLSRGISYLGKTKEEAKSIQRGINFEDAYQEAENLKELIEAELQKQTQQSTKNLRALISECKGIAKCSIQN
jgi:hypothetical protein